MLNNMTMSRKGRMALVGSEAVILVPYKDSVGVWTIGIGHTKAAGDPDPVQLIGSALTVNEVLELFRRDLRHYEKAVCRTLTRKPSQHQFDAMVHFCYNVGPGAFARAQWVKSFNAGDDKAAAQQIMNWMKPPEIKGRRLVEKHMFEKGVYPPQKAKVSSKVNKNHVPIAYKVVDITEYFPEEVPPKLTPVPQRSPAPVTPQEILNPVERKPLLTKIREWFARWF